MITQAHGNLLDADVEALVNTVNCAGVMGKGIALQFKRAYPAMFREYARAAESGEVTLGRMHVWRTGLLAGPRFVINFPTKGHWRARSSLVDIDNGLTDLVRVLEELNIKSVAIPPLGCGNGGLEWTDVEPMIRTALVAVPHVDVVLYPPGPAPTAQQMKTATVRPPLTLARASLIGLLSRYLERALEASPIEIQKLLYFLQVAGEPLKLQYAKGLYGPYADNLRHALQALEGHYLVGFGDGSALVREAEPIRPLPGADTEAASFLASHPVTLERIARVLDLVEGFESSYGMELLATVHWVSERDPNAASDATVAVSAVRAWSRRKERMFMPDHVTVAWTALRDRDWIAAA
ncbi:macro domain-containing protein [Dactylosporangium roseum]|uniref:Macro domain-containing protein n=1 Tax=Dactylosporangium roseum TaxID=47989 RepID=A0ABY5Z668_9ACTN|nr:macro domain-containing protein [Dactylosporangium roseum]UWZ35909.1 macro domain-containing protein [Dactylosporangium roseum]